MYKIAPEILECTLRDGSYALDFQFTAMDTRKIAQRLDDLGFPWIEVGHGVGLGASVKGKGASAATDVEYMIAAADVVNNGKWGMFCIPGIAEIEHLDIAAEHKMDFVRIGCEVADVHTAKPFIERARSLGLFVFSNLMKSYAGPINYFVNQAGECIAYGAQYVYIVDSAGGMLPNEIIAYADALHDVFPEIKLGFHGHNNIGMGVCNSLQCADNGFDVIDSSLQGIGRSAGNTPTEQIIVALIRSGYKVPYDPIEVMQAGEDMIRPLMREPGFSSLDVTAGLALFHSSYMRRVLEVAKFHRIDPRRLILALCDRDRVNAPIELIEECALTVMNHPIPYGRLHTVPYFGEEQK